MAEYIKQLEDGRIIQVRDHPSHPELWQMHWDISNDDPDCPWRTVKHSVPR